MTSVDTCVCNINDIIEASFVFYDYFEMFLGNLIWSRSK